MSSTPNSEDIDHQLHRLRIYRETLAVYLNQQAQFGSAYVPPYVIHGIAEAREHIRRIKSILQAWGVPYDDHVDDEAVPPHASSAQTPQPLVGAAPAVWRELSRALEQCDEFQTPARLRAVFVVPPLNIWQRRLPEADSVSERVDLTIAYLREKRTSNGEPALVLMLKALAERYEPGDKLHDLLGDLASWLQAYLSA